jgi:hypothetical protein
MNSAFPVSPHLLTLAVCATASVAISTLWAERMASSEEVGQSSSYAYLPNAIEVAEAAYESVQSALESQLAAVRFQSLALPTPEARREVISKWMEEHRAELEAQATASAEIDELYAQHDIKPFARILALIKAHEGADAEAHPANRLRELMELRAQYAHDPEACQVAVNAWAATAIDSVLTDSELADGIQETSPATEANGAMQSDLDLALESEQQNENNQQATAAYRQLATIEQNLLSQISALPSLLNSDFATREIAEVALEARRDAAASLLMDQANQLAPLRETVAAEAVTRFLSRKTSASAPSTLSSAQ